MVYLKDVKAYIQQSTLLLQARPTTTRIATRYTLVSSQPLHRPISVTTSNPTPTSTRRCATLTFTTYDPVSGICIKYKTSKAAEVGRLVAGLGQCGRTMAGLSLASKEDYKTEGGPVADEQNNMAEAKSEARTNEAKSVLGTNNGQANAKKKKKGKR